MISIGRMKDQPEVKVIVMNPGRRLNSNRK